MPTANNPISLNIAIVEDDRILREELGHFLSSHGHTVHEAVNGLGLDDLAQETDIDLVILDLNLPGESGLAIAERYRQLRPELGIVILSARTADVDRIQSYEQGADIYIPKPCPPHELLAAIRSLARRIRSNQSADTWQLDCVRHLLCSADGLTNIQLLTVETRILRALARAPQRQLDTESLCIWLVEGDMDTDFSEGVTKRALENKISRLRKKFAQKTTTELLLIRSVRGEGYQLCLPVNVLSDEAMAEKIPKNDSPDQ
jgi:DNA-binding response OmpR family regulator